MDPNPSSSHAVPAATGACGIEVRIPAEAQEPLRLWIEVLSQPHPSPEILKALAGLITEYAVRQACEVASPAGARAGLAAGRLARVLTFIEQHLAEPLRIERIASAAHMSPFHFARLFKQATGHTPHGYLTLRRIERAKALLSTNALPLVHIASSVGFQTQGHFTEVFHRYAGLTPRRFRLQVQQAAGFVSRSNPEPEATPSWNN